MRGLLLLALALSGCHVGASGRSLVQPQGATVALAVRGEDRVEVLAGELLAVEPDGFLVDAFDAAGARVRAVRVPAEAILRGAVYLGPTQGVETRSARSTPDGTRRVGRLDAGGRFTEPFALEALSRFPRGISDAARRDWLAARGQASLLSYREAPLRPDLP